MKLDLSSLRLTERHIEDALHGDPHLVCSDFFRIERWVKRQYKVPSGIIDLLGVTSGGDLAVVEVKNVEVDSRAVAQVCRYAKDVGDILSVFDAEEISKGRWPQTTVRKILIGPSIPEVVFRECEACHVTYLEFSVNISLGIDGMYWPREFMEQRDREYKILADDPEMAKSVQECYEISAGYKAVFAPSVNTGHESQEEQP